MSNLLKIIDENSSFMNSPNDEALQRNAIRNPDGYSCKLRTK